MRARGAIFAWVVAVGVAGLPCHADSVVVFNEISYHPRDDAAGLEWIELYNQMGIAVDVSGWSLSGAVAYTFREGTRIGAGEYLVVAASPQDVWTLAGDPAKVLGPFTGRLDNGGGTLRLYNNSARLMNQVKYGDDGQWPVAPDGSGATLAKVNSLREGDSPENWTWSDQVNGSPGWENFDPTGPMPRGVWFNEVTGAQARPFQIELVNTGSEPVDVAGYTMEVQGRVPASFSLRPMVLQPGAYAVLTDTDLGLIPEERDRLFLRSADGRVLDAVRTDRSLRGRYPDGMGPWLFPASPTLGSANRFQVCQDIVINEILYHPLETPVVHEERTITLVPARAQARTLVPKDGSLGARWTGGLEPFDDSAWTGGPGLVTGIGYETGSGYEPYIGTDVRAAMYGARGSVFVRVGFEVPDPAGLESLTLRIRYDDGFVAFLNGVEVARANAPTSLAWDSVATGSHDDTAAVVHEAFDISDPLAVLKPGPNILALQGLNVSVTSSDFLLDPVLEATEQEGASGSSGSGPESRTWIELYNKGLTTVDLSGWRLARGVEFTFPAGTVVGPGEYLVVAKDPATLRPIHPDVRILGDFSGSLSNKDEEVLLEDQVGNPVDRVHYYDGGAWPAYADGGGCSGELRDPRADNDLPGAWAASDESGRTAWQPFSYRGVATSSPVGDDSLYSEFVMGLLDAGEVLIDDLHVMEDPDGAATEMLQNGDFTPGAVKWRIMGNHRLSRVEPDPVDGANPVLHLVASGPTEHMHNHAETTLAAGRRITNGRTYEVRFRARWVAGSPLLHTRLFFNRLARTTVLPVPDSPGTPGRRNSRYQANMGPTCADLRHQPAVPGVRQPVTVTVRAGDPDGIQAMTLHFREDGKAWQAAAMTLVNGVYSAAIRERGAGTLFQFYIEAQDGLGAVSFYPAAGPDSFAQYRVQDNKARTTGVHNYRIVMRNAQRDLLYEPTNLMSNERLGATLIVNEREVYYNAGVRLKSSEHGRPKDTRVGFDISLGPEWPLRGVHEDVSLDRSNGQQVGQQEMLLHAAMNRFGGPSKYHDMGYVIAPKDAHSSGVEVQMARFDTIYCEEAYGKAGGAGTLFEYELVYPLTQTMGNDPEGLKIPQEGGGVRGLPVSTYLGTDKESYRWHFLIKNHRDLDDYDPIIRMTSVLGLRGQALDQGIARTLDVAEWMTSFAVGSTHGTGDNWIDWASHNALFYHRPTDDKVLFFLHDLDYPNGSMQLKANGVLQEITTLPHWNRVFYSDVYGFLQTSYNRTYMSFWASHYADRLPEQSWSSWLSYMDARSRNVMSQVAAAVPSRVPFGVTSASWVSAQKGLVRVQGRAWLDVREIRQADANRALDPTWVDLVTWQADVPAEAGRSTITLEAYDWLGNPAGAETIAIPPTPD